LNASVAFAAFDTDESVYASAPVEAQGSPVTYFAIGTSLFRRNIPKPDTSAFCEKFKRLKALRAEINRLGERCVEFGLEAPNRVSIGAAETILMACVGFQVRPDRVVASAEGGVSVVFFNGAKRATLECLNCGDLVASIAKGSEPSQVWDFSPQAIYATVASISEFLAD
jgi:hypothetical protein